MLKPAHLGLSIALLFCHSMPNAEASLNKCTDGKQITYTTEPCEKTGLSSAGPIKDAVTVVPILPKPQKDSPEKPGKGHGEDNDIFRNNTPRNDGSGADVSKDATIKPANPLANKILN